ncbi:hypothetical protein [Vulgatibacter sp.]|uniref:hypothetical protein n=1 Tax=Vulgatibacter sp. TaxID=1971226 RepID=UPI00356B5672
MRWYVGLLLSVGVSLALSALGLVVVFSIFSGMCDRWVAARIPAPDGLRAVVLWKSDCGALGDARVSAVVELPGQDDAVFFAAEAMDPGYRFFWLGNETLAFCPTEEAPPPPPTWAPVQLVGLPACP